jgi:hypothetical protein
MAYVVNNTRGQIIAVVQDGTVNTTATSQTLVGKNVTPYGEYEVENLVHQLENFANTTAPGNPIEGQIWYNTTEEALYAYSGEEWKPASGMAVSTVAPTSDPRVGNLWFNTTTQQVLIYSAIGTGFGWIPVSKVTVASSAPSANSAGELYFNSATKQLFAYDGSTWNLIGPEGVSGFATTRWTSSTLLDVGSVAHAVILGTVNGTTVSIVSTDSFTILGSQRPTGFVSLVSGINLASGSVVNGRSTQADSLTTPRTINGVAFDGTANITIGNAGELTAGTGLSGTPYSGTVPQTWTVDSTTTNTPNKVVARDSLGDFAARVVTAEVVGNVSGTSQNVRGLVGPGNGGTGFTIYSEGDVLVGTSEGSLAKTQITGTGPISVSSSGNGIQISYAGGTGTGNVTSVGIDTGAAGLSITGSPITGAGTITINNTGVTRFGAGTGLSTTGTNGNITVTNTGVTSLTAGAGIGLSGSTGGVTVTNTGVTKIIAGANISISPGAGTGEVIVSSSGGSGGTGGAGSVTQVQTGAGLTGGPITSSGTIAVDASVIRSNVAQTISAVKTYTGGIVSQAYNFTTTGNSIYWMGAAMGLPYNVVQIAVDNTFSHLFYKTRYVVEGNADGIAGELYRGGVVVGADGGSGGGAGVMGWHTNSIAGLGIGTGATASSVSFTGAVFQGASNRPKSDAFIQFRSYSNNDPVFQVTGAGNVSADGTYTSPAADYAEYFEWADGNPNNQDRVGMSVSLVGNKIRIAQPGDTIIGVISATPAVIGDAAELEWNQKYLTDDFGRGLQEEYHAWEWTDENGKIHSVASYEDVSHVPTTATKKTHDGLGNLLTRPVLNPAYDPAGKYTPRSQRKEWDPVGLVGKLRLHTGQPVASTWIKLRDISQTVQEWLVK